MSYDVYIERARDSSPIAVAQVAGAIAERFRLPAEAVSKRMASGRFRVKSNTDQATAERFAGELEKLGAVVSVVDTATGQPLARSSVAQAPAAEPTDGPGSSALAGAAAPVAEASPSGEFASGLAAAFSGDEAQQDIGALSEPASGSFSLATLDGDEESAPAAPPSGEFAPTDSGEQLSEDMFAPPDESEEVGLAIELNTPPPERITPPPAAAAPGGELLSLLPEGAESEAVVSDGGTAAGASGPGKLLGIFANNAIARAVAGALLAVLLGFAPAHVVGMLREGAYDAPRAAVERADADYRGATIATEAELIERNTRLDKVRSDQQAIMEETRSSIALTAGVVWLVVAGGVGFVWFRKIDWDRWA